MIFHYLQVLQFIYTFIHIYTTFKSETIKISLFLEFLWQNAKYVEKTLKNFISNCYLYNLVLKRYSFDGFKISKQMRNKLRVLQISFAQEMLVNLEFSFKIWNKGCAVNRPKIRINHIYHLERTSKLLKPSFRSKCALPSWLDLKDIDRPVWKYISKLWIHRV